MLGWEPEERHEHFDASGNLTGYTVVTREAEWDDRQRDLMDELAAYEAGLCACGFHESLTSDPANNFFEPIHQTCTVCAGVMRYKRVTQHADEQAMKAHGDDPAPSIGRPEDGRRLFVRKMSPVEAEERRASRGKPRQAPNADPSPVQHS